jgi:hypothetical protein
LRDLTSDQEALLVKIFNSNNQVNGSFGFNGTRPDMYGPGLTHYLSEFTQTYYFCQENNGIFTLGELPF